MHLVAAVVPPADAVDEVNALLRGVRPPVTPVSRPAGWRRKQTGRRAAREAVQEAPQPADLEPEDLFVPLPGPSVLVAKFGHLSVSDAERLETRLRTEAAEWPAPLLRFEGVDLEASAATGSVTLNVEGDTSALRDLVGGVQDVAARSQLFIDRRVFRPLIEIGSLTPAASAEYAESLLSALDGFVGGWWWQTHLSLVVPGPMATDAPRTHARLELKARSGPT